MALSNAEKQARYRARRGTVDDGAGEYRLNTWISAPAHMALTRLARHGGQTKKAIIEQLIIEADQEIQDGLSDEAHDAYLDLSLNPIRW